MRISDWSSDVCSSDLASRSPAPCCAEAHADIGLERVADRADQPEPAERDERQRQERAGAGTEDAVVEIGRASCRERVCQYVSDSVVAVSIKKKRMQQGKLEAQDENNTRTT